MYSENSEADVIDQIENDGKVSNKTLIIVYHFYKFRIL